MAYFGPERTGGLIGDLLAQIDQNIGEDAENFDEGDDISDNELLNGFMDAFNDESDGGT